MKDINFEQELYNHFGQIKDFTLGMRIGQYFYELGCRRTKEQYHFFNKAWADDMQAELDRNYENGKLAMKEQMMKGAVEGTVYGNGVYTWVAGDIPSQFKYGDKVLIIIVKEDEK